jgi:tetratricopeptide (TPR) repeat protein
LLIRGEPGIGKTRIGTELGKFAKLQGIAFQRTGCRPSDTDRPLCVFVDLIPQLRELPGALGCSQETLFVLKRLTEFNGTGSETTQEFDELASFYENMRRALLDLLDAISEEQTLLILVEDIQWLDGTSAKLFAEIVEWCKNRKLLFLFNARPGDNTLTDLTPLTGLKSIELLPLERHHAEQLLRFVVSGRLDTAHDSVLEWLISVGEGNPFFLQELGKHWMETGDYHDVPPSVAAVLDTRLSRISSNGLHVLQAFAVLGENATMGRVEAVLAYQPHQLLAAVQEISSAGMLIPSGRLVGNAAQLRVRHDLVSTAAIARLTSIALAYLHRRAGSVLEQRILATRSPTSLLWAAAFHWANAGDNERALAAAQSCAEQLLEMGLPSDACAAFQRTIEYCDTDEAKLRVLSRYVLALQMNGQWEQSRELLLRCMDLRRRIAPHASAHDELELRLFDASWRASLDNTGLLQDLLNCVLSTEADPAHRVRCGLLGLKVGHNLGAIELMRRLYQNIEPLLRTADVDRLTRFEIQLVFHCSCGDPERALDGLGSFLEFIRAAKNPFIAARALGNAAFACRMAGRWEEALGLLSEVFQHSLDHGLLDRASSACFALVRLFLAARQVDRAREALDRGESLRRCDEDIHTTADQQYLAAKVAFEEGDLKQATVLYKVVQESLTDQHSINRRAATLELGIRINIESAGSRATLEGLVRELHAAHLVTRATGWQDDEAYALYLGYCALGQKSCGKRMLAEYVGTHRRERFRVPLEIASAINGRAIQPESQNHIVSGTLSAFAQTPAS